MLLQTNSYVVPKDKRAEHERLVRRIRQTMLRLGCDLFEVYEQVGHNWTPLRGNDRFIQMMRFRDRRHHQQVQAAERSDPGAQQLIRDFCALVNLPQQQDGGLFAIGFYAGVFTTHASEYAPEAAEPSATETPAPADRLPDTPSPAGGNNAEHGQETV